MTPTLTPHADLTESGVPRLAWSQPLFRRLFTSPGRRQNPYPVYDTLRAEGSLLSMAPGIWIVTSHRAVATALRSQALVSFPPTELNPLLGRRTPVLSKMVHRWMPFTEDPVHTIQRTPLQHMFAPANVEDFAASATAVLDGLLPSPPARIDIVATVADVLPFLVISRVTNVPTDDFHLARRWGTEFARLLDPVVPVGDIASLEAYAKEFVAWTGRLLARPIDSDARVLPGVPPDVFAQYTAEDLAAVFTFLQAAGYETTRNAVASATLLLARFPDQRARLVEDPSLIRSAVEEILRYEAPVQLTVRVAREECELDGVPISPGDRLILLLGSANRDPETFERADEFDIGRERNPHVSFGVGRHYCLGAALARSELRAYVNALVALSPEYTIDDSSIRWPRSATIRGPRRMMVNL